MCEGVGERRVLQRPCWLLGSSGHRVGFRALLLRRYFVVNHAKTRLSRVGITGTPTLTMASKKPHWYCASELRRTTAVRGAENAKPEEEKRGFGSLWTSARLSHAERCAICTGRTLGIDQFHRFRTMVALSCLSIVIKEVWKTQARTLVAVFLSPPT